MAPVMSGTVGSAGETVEPLPDYDSEEYWASLTPEERYCRKDILARNGYGTTVIPNINMNNMQSVFYNKATNLFGFEKAIQEQRNRYQNKWEWVQWLFYRELRSNIETISPSS